VQVQSNFGSPLKQALNYKLIQQSDMQKTFFFFFLVSDPGYIASWEASWHVAQHWLPATCKCLSGFF